MTALQVLVAACESLAADSRYAKKTRALATALKGFALTISPTLQQIGPLRVSFDAEGIHDNGAVLADGVLPAGAVILAAWLEVTEQWEFPSSAALEILAAPDSNPGDFEGLVEYSTGAGTSIYLQGDAAIAQEAGSSVPSEAAPRWITRMIEPGKLALYANGSAPTAGAGNVYALIAVADGVAD